MDSVMIDAKLAELDVMIQVGAKFAELNNTKTPSLPNSCQSKQGQFAILKISSFHVAYSICHQFSK
jgi:hypothetical protein